MAGDRTVDAMNEARERRCEVLVIGGGAAGLAAALQLGRSRRSVVVVDSGEPRNAAAEHMHSYLGHEGRPPLEFLALARDEVRLYGAELVDGRVGEVVRLEGGGFRATLVDGATVSARRVLVATGVSDELPDIPGVAEQWGRGVLHCPYCHGWEVQDQRVTVVATGPAATHQALLFRQLTERLTVVRHDGGGLDGDDRARLTARGVEILEGPVVEVVSERGAVVAVRLGDGTVVPTDAVVVAPRSVPRLDGVAGLGLATTAAPNGLGEVVATDASGATNVAGVYAAGNVSDLGNQVLQAAATGARIGAVINADLAMADADAAVAARPNPAREWDERYGERDQMWSGRVNGALVAEVADLPPGRALDVGCGEGADAIWLAQRGWKVTAVDISQVAVDRAREAADAAGVSVEWVCADVTTTPPAQASYDLVTAQYPALPRSDATVDSLLAAVAPGGTLLVTWHALSEEHAAHMRERGTDPDDYVQRPDVVARLDDRWEIVVDETRPRIDPPPGSPHVDDIVLRARRIR